MQEETVGAPGAAIDVAALARRLVDAREAGRTLPAVTSTTALRLDEANRVQDAVLALRLQRGERLVGWKLGYTSAAMRAQMGIHSPNAGPLTDVMALDPAHAVVPEGALQPLVEPEVAFVLAGPVEPGAGALAAVRSAHASLEVVDPVWAGLRFGLEDNTADGSSAAWFVLGPELPLDGLDGCAVVLERDGVEQARATGAAAGGHPASGLLWLAEHLAGRGRRLRAGDIVLSGGLTRAVALAPGASVAATFTPPGAAPVRVAVRRAGG